MCRAHLAFTGHTGANPCCHNGGGTVWLWSWSSVTPNHGRPVRAAHEAHSARARARAPLSKDAREEQSTTGIPHGTAVREGFPQDIKKDIFQHARDQTHTASFYQTHLQREISKGLWLGSLQPIQMPSTMVGF